MAQRIQFHQHHNTTPQYLSRMHNTNPYNTQTRGTKRHGNRALYNFSDSNPSADNTRKYTCWTLATTLSVPPPPSQAKNRAQVLRECLAPTHHNSYKGIREPLPSNKRPQHQYKEVLLNPLKEQSGIIVPSQDLVVQQAPAKRSQLQAALGKPDLTHMTSTKGSGTSKEAPCQ